MAILAQVLALSVLEADCINHALIPVTVTLHVAMCAHSRVPMPALLVSKGAGIIATTASVEKSAKSLVLLVWSSASGSVSTTGVTRSVEKCVTALAVTNHVRRR